MTLFETAIGPRVLHSYQIEEGYKVEVVETRHPADLDRIAYQLLATRVCGKPPPPFDKISTAGNPWAGSFYYTTETLEEADGLAKKYVEFAKWWLESPNRRGDIAYADANIIDGIATLRAEVERLRSALRLLWEEATTEDRCATEYAPGCYGHHISKPCRDAVGAVLKEGDR